MASCTIFWVFGMTRPKIEPRSLGPLANTLLIRPMARLTILLCVIFRVLHLCLFWSQCRLLPHRAYGGQSLWPTVSRPKTPCIFCESCIYNFTMPLYSVCHPCDVLPLIYTGAFCNHIVYTAGTSGSVIGQYATVRIPQQQYFIPRKQCQHTQRERMECY